MIARGRGGEIAIELVRVSVPELSRASSHSRTVTLSIPSVSMGEERGKRELSSLAEAERGERVPRRPAR